MPTKTKKSPTAKAKTTAKKTAAKTTAKAKPPVAKKAANKPGSNAYGPVSITPYKEKAREKYMSVKMRQHFRDILNIWKHQLMEEVDRTVHHMQKEAANFPDPNDRASQEEEFSLELRTRDRERKLIRKIEEALTMIDDEEYGYCETCGIEIGIRRLEARPTATLCIDCKTLDEIKEKQFGD